MRVVLLIAFALPACRGTAVTPAPPPPVPAPVWPLPEPPAAALGDVAWPPAVFPASGAWVGRVAYHAVDAARGAPDLIVSARGLVRVAEGRTRVTDVTSVPGDTRVSDRLADALVSAVGRVDVTLPAPPGWRLRGASRDGIVIVPADPNAAGWVHIGRHGLLRAHLRWSGRAQSTSDDGATSWLLELELHPEQVGAVDPS